MLLGLKICAGFMPYDAWPCKNYAAWTCNVLYIYLQMLALFIFSVSPKEKIDIYV